MSRIWGSENPQVIKERQLFTVWCALWSEVMIGPYFFENNDGKTVTVNSERYDHMITDIFLPAIKEYKLDNMWFKQDGAICQTIRANMALLQETFTSRVISRKLATKIMRFNTIRLLSLGLRERRCLCR